MPEELFSRKYMPDIHIPPITHCRYRYPLLLGPLSTRLGTAKDVCEQYPKQKCGLRASRGQKNSEIPLPRLAWLCAFCGGALWFTHGWGITKADPLAASFSESDAEHKAEMHDATIADIHIHSDLRQSLPPHSCPHAMDLARDALGLFSPDPSCHTRENGYGAEPRRNSVGWG